MPSPQIERKLKAIMFTDIVNFSLMMGEDEDNTILLLDKHNEISNKVFSKYKGKLIKQLCDGNFVEYNSSLDAGPLSGGCAPFRDKQ